MSRDKVKTAAAAACLAAVLLAQLPASTQELYVRAGAPNNASYWLGSAHVELPLGHSLGALGTGLVVNTAGTPSIYAGTTCTNQFVRLLSAVGAATCASVDLASDVTGRLALANLPAGSANGDLLVRNGSDWVVFPRGAVGQFLRTNPSASPMLEWASAPNVADQDADVTNSSNVTFTELTNMAAAPAADTWVDVSCRLWYQSAATTTGITVSVWANNVGATAAPQFISAKVLIGGVAASGTDEATAGYITAHGGTFGTTATVNTTNWFLIEIKANILTHATDAGFLIWPRVRSEVNLSGVTIKEGSQCSTTVNHVDS